MMQCFAGLHYVKSSYGAVNLWDLRT